MTNRKMNTIQVEDAIVGEEGALSPHFILLSQRLVESTDRAGTGSHYHEGLSHLSDFMRACPTDKHLGQRLGYLRFIAVVALEHLTVKCSLPISWHLQILNASSRGDEITGVVTIAIASTIRGDFSP